MIRFYIALLAICIIIQGSFQEILSEQECASFRGNGGIVILSLKSKKHGGGEWVDEFSARAISSNSSDSIDVAIKHSAFECQGRRVLDIKSVSNDASSTEGISDTRLYFHTRSGKNVAIINHGRSVQKINANDPHNAVVFTKTALKDNEIFEIKLDKKTARTNHCLGIGVMTASPADVNILPEMHKSPNAWMYHHSNIYSNAALLLEKYGKNLDQLQVGDRVGVMRSEFGAIHFFFNGVDQGPAASNIPSPVHGVLELWHDAIQATIV